MFKILVGKQFYEIFRGFFYNPKTNAKRSKTSAILFIALSVFLMLFLAATFAGVSFSLCDPLVQADCGWLYFAIVGAVATLLGSFGSVFTTYSSLYLSKDDDLLLSMPIPFTTIVLSRLFGVYVLGLMYSAVVSLPAAIVYLCTAELTVGALIGSLLYVILISLLVLVISCILGYIVARLSVKLKNKSYITVIIALIAFALYYYVIFKFKDVLGALLESVRESGASLKGEHYLVYMIGCVGEGNVIGMIISALVHVALAALTVFVIAKSFLKVKSAIVGVSKVKARKIANKQTSVFFALVRKEGARFVSSSTYMLNGGMSLVMLLLVSVAIFIFREKLSSLVDAIGIGGASFPLSLAAMAIAVCVSLTEIVVPSLSLEGKSFWQLRSAPISPLTVLNAKAAFQLFVSLPFVFISSVVVAIALSPNIFDGVMLVVSETTFFVFITLFDLIIGVKTANLNWTNEVVPIKQNFNIPITFFGGMLIALLAFAPYIPFSGMMGFGVYALIVVAVFTLASVGLYAVVKGSCVRTYEEL